MTERYENVRKVTLSGGRWQIRIDLELADDTTQTYYADGGLTHGDGIWFGTAAEYAEAALGG